MRIAGETIGARGLAVLSATAVAGVLMGVHGWTGRGHGLPPGLSSSKPPAAASSPAASPTPSSTTTPAGGAHLAPTLSSEPYASYSYQVWPGPVSAAAATAETGLVIKVRPSGSGLLVAAAANGSQLPAATFYAGGAKVWVIEASLGDDSGNADLNLGDDGLVVTNAQGRIVR